MVDDHVDRLDVSVHDTHAVRVLQCLAEFVEVDPTIIVSKLGEKSF